ncbi:MAG TPA: TolC family protein [Longimicrobiales bacterium]
MQTGTIIRVLACALLLGTGQAAAQEPPGFTLDEVYALARERSPVLRAAHFAVEASRAREGAAALPPDPTLEIGAMNLSLPGLSADMPASMAPQIQVMQMLPFPGKLRLARRIAVLGTGIARADADEAWWEVRSRAAAAFYDIYEADARIRVLRETLELLRGFQAAATALYATGEGRQSDALRAGVEVARMEADLRRMRAMRTAAAAKLNAILDRPADTPVPAPVFPALPLGVPAPDTLRAWAEESQPMLAAGRTRVEQARARSALARKEIWPDPAIGLAYGQRAGAMGTERMGSAMIGFSVPVFAGRRQLRMRDEAEAMEQMARAELTQARAWVTARIAELSAGLERTRDLVRLYRAEVLPQARANVESSFSSYRTGAVDFATLVDAQLAVNRFEQEYHTLLAEYGRTLADLEMTIGRALPVDGETLAEVP